MLLQAESNGMNATARAKRKVDFFRTIGVLIAILIDSGLGDANQQPVFAVCDTKPVRWCMA